MIYVTLEQRIFLIQGQILEGFHTSFARLIATWSQRMARWRNERQIWKR